MDEARERTVEETPVLDVRTRPDNAEWTGNFSFSSNGQQAAGIIVTEEGEFGVATNEGQWDAAFENLWKLSYTPDGRLTALTSSLGVWTLIVDQEPWPEEYEYIWEPIFSAVQSRIAAAIKQDGQYAMAVDGQDWPRFFLNATGFTMDHSGSHTGCVVQTKPLDAGDIKGFQAGAFTVAVDGRPWERNFINVWSPALASSGGKAAATVRTTLDTYTIAVDGQPWPTEYAMAWEPLCISNGSVLAPVMLNKRWGLAQDGHMLWDPDYLQLWHVQSSSAGQNIWAIGSPRYGHFTIICNNRPWNHTYPVLTDLRMSPDGQRAAAVGQSPAQSPDNDQGLARQKWQVIVDDKPWSGWYDQVFPPVFSPDSRHVAVRVKHNGYFAFLLDGALLPRTFDAAWDPVFTWNGDAVLIRARSNDQLVRVIAPFGQFES